MADVADGGQSPPGGSVPWYLRSTGTPQDDASRPDPAQEHDATGPMPPLPASPGPTPVAQPAPTPAPPPAMASAPVPPVLQATPPASSTRPPVPRALVIGVAAAVVLVLGGGAVAWALKSQGGDDSGTVVAAATTTRAASSATRTSSPVPTTTVPVTTAALMTASTADPSVVAEQAALSQLESLRAASLQRVVLDGRYVAQVASKSIGITDPLQTAQNGTHTFFATDILAESEAARQRAPGDEVLLLQSSDFGTSRTAPNGQPYWVTLVDGGFTSSADVKAWCASTFASLDQQSRDNACAVRTLTPPH
jgi:hypothetical protein